MADLNDAWRSYLANVVPSAAGSAQREETRLAFFAGATVAASLLAHGRRSAVLADLEAFDADTRRRAAAQEDADG